MMTENTAQTFDEMMSEIDKNIGTLRALIGSAHNRIQDANRDGLGNLIHNAPEDDGERRMAIVVHGGLMKAEQQLKAMAELARHMETTFDLHNTVFGDHVK